MRLTTRTNLAMRTLMFCAANPGQIVRRQDVADACQGSENHLAQVIHLLARAGFLRTIRGRSGGLMLARAPEDITIGEVFRTFEAPVPFTECFGGEGGDCPLVAVCRLKCILTEALESFYARLDQATILDLVSKNVGLQGILHVA